MNGIDKVITNRNQKDKIKKLIIEKKEYNYILGLYISNTY